MPTIPPSSSSQYDPVYVALHSARARLNDNLPTLAPTGGSILNLQTAATQQLTNNAFRKMQDALADRGYADLIGDQVISGIPAVANLDPASQCWLSWTGCFDGSNYFPLPCLPADFTHPVRLWERWSGQNAQFCDMSKWLDGLPTPSKWTLNRIWEWRGDAIYFPGSLNVEDIRVRYFRFKKDFQDIGNVRWFNQEIEIMRGSDSLSWFICYEVASSRGTPADMAQAGVFMANALKTLDHIFNLDVNANARVNISRQPRSRRQGNIGGSYW